MLTIVFLALVGLASGIGVAAGIFAFIISLGVIERMAAVTKTFKHIKKYETIVFLGATFGNTISIYNISFGLGDIVAGLFALFSGVFTGILAIALVETLKSIPIMMRRVKLRKGLGLIIINIALGKLVGSLFQLWNGWGT